MPPGFSVHLTNDLEVQQARSDAIAAYNFLAAQGPGTVLAAQLNGAVLTAGIYSFAGGAADLAALGTLTLNGPGVFVFGDQEEALRLRLYRPRFLRKMAVRISRKASSRTT